MRRPVKFHLWQTATDITGGASLVQSANHLQKSSQSSLPQVKFHRSPHSTTPAHHMTFPIKSGTDLLETMTTETFCMYKSGNGPTAPVSVGNGEKRLLQVNLTSENGTKFFA